MKPITVALRYSDESILPEIPRSVSQSPLVERALIVSPRDVPVSISQEYDVIRGNISSETTLSAILNLAGGTHLLFVLTSQPFSFEPGGLERLLSRLTTSGAGAVYGDFLEEGPTGRTVHPLNDYQMGSVREGFDFGPVMLFSAAEIARVQQEGGLIPGNDVAAFYDLRLKVAEKSPILRVNEPLSSVASSAVAPAEDRLFAYVDPRNRAAQIEFETVFTDHLKRTDVYLPASSLRSVESHGRSFPVEASVVIPVKNRKNTIADAVGSALDQEAPFPFNVIVIDNHSTDGTTEVLARLSRKDGPLVHVIPDRADLAIGGCWNLAINRPECGRYAVQLDSDDLYNGKDVIRAVVETFRRTRAAMVIGSYTLVNEALREIPPGLIGHEEWTDENGHNNGLRVNGFGAPRAFCTAIARATGFPDVSYGEDYAITLRICRKYRIARIFESLYLCRRWSGNTDARLTIEETNRHDAFKDSLRTNEMAARQALNAAHNG